MFRKHPLMIVVLLAVVASVSASGRHTRKAGGETHGEYLYFDTAGRPLNCDQRGEVHPLAESDSARVTSRSFIDFGEGGTPNDPGRGAICRLQEPCAQRVVAMSSH